MRIRVESKYAFSRMEFPDFRLDAHQNMGNKRAEQSEGSDDDWVKIL